MLYKSEGWSRHEIKFITSSLQRMLTLSIMQFATGKLHYFLERVNILQTSESLKKYFLITTRIVKYVTGLSPESHYRVCPVSRGMSSFSLQESSCLFVCYLSVHSCVNQCFIMFSYRFTIYSCNISYNTSLRFRI